MLHTDAHPEMKRDLRFFPSQTRQPKTLTRAQVNQYNEKGFVFPLDVFETSEIEANRTFFDDLMDRAAAAGHNSYSINGWDNRFSAIYDLAIESRILDYVEDLIGPNIVCTMTHFFCKEPGEVKQVAWHQDASYWPITPSKIVTVWLAVDDVDDGNGPMTVIPGSHRHGQIPYEKLDDMSSNVLSQSVPNPLDWGDPPVQFVMKAGQISIHSVLLLHGSAPNYSNRRRCGLTLRYNPPDVRREHQHSGTAIIARGNESGEYWQHRERPKGNTIPDPR